MATRVKNRILRRDPSSCESAAGSVFNSSSLETTGLETAGFQTVELETVEPETVWLKTAEFSGAITILLLH
jgi:hypothetical protein